MQIEKIKYLSL